MKKRNFRTHENQYEEYKRCTKRILSQLSSFDVDKVEIEKAHIPELQFEVCTILIAESSGMRVASEASAPRLSAFIGMLTLR